MSDDVRHHVYEYHGWDEPSLSTPALARFHDDTHIAGRLTHTHDESGDVKIKPGFTLYSRQFAGVALHG